MFTSHTPQHNNPSVGRKNFESAKKTPLLFFKIVSSLEPGSNRILALLRSRFVFL